MAINGAFLLKCVEAFGHARGKKEKIRIFYELLGELSKNYFVIGHYAVNIRHSADIF